MAEDFDVVDLDEEKTSKFAEAMKSPTSRKILNLLKKKVCSKKDIAESLNIPLPTVHYNLERLLSAGLVEVADFYWSPKGNKVNLYKASKKIMVFTPEKKPKLSANLKLILSALVILIGVFAAFAAFNLGENKKDFSSSSAEGFSSNREFMSALMEGKKIREKSGFSASDESASSRSSRRPASVSGSSGQMASRVDVPGEKWGPNPPFVGISPYSFGDLAFFDGKNLYLTQDNKVTIINTVPPKDMNKLSELSLPRDEYLREILAKDGKLVIISSKSLFVKKGDPLLKGRKTPDSSIAVVKISPSGEGSQEGLIIDSVSILGFDIVRIYDVSNPKSPRLEKMISVEGNNPKAKIQGNNIYLANYFDPYVIPEVSREEDSEEDVGLTEAECLEVLPRYAEGEREFKLSKENLNPIVSSCKNVKRSGLRFGDMMVNFLKISLEDLSVKKGSILASGGGFLYLTEGNLYVFESISPVHEPTPLPERERKIGGPTFPRGMAVPPSAGNVVREGEYSRADQKSYVTKYRFNGANLEYVASKELSGVTDNLLVNEFGENIRIFTEVEYLPKSLEGEIKNKINFYILDKNLNEIGSLNNVLEKRGRGIYDVVFIKDKIYLKPLYDKRGSEGGEPTYTIIDVSNPSSPRVAGKLESEGSIDFVFSFNDNYIIGIGKDKFIEPIISSGGGYGGTYEVTSKSETPKRVSRAGEPEIAVDNYDPNERIVETRLKAFLFDVSDLKNPKEIDSSVFGGPGSKWEDSSLMEIGRGVFIDEERGLFVFPVSIMDKAGENLEFRGAYVLDLSSLKIKLLGSLPVKKLEDGTFNSIIKIFNTKDNAYILSLEWLQSFDLNSFSEVGSLKIDVFKNLKRMLQ